MRALPAAPHDDFDFPAWIEAHRAWAVRQPTVDFVRANGERVPHVAGSFWPDRPCPRVLVTPPPSGGNL